MTTHTHDPAQAMEAERRVSLARKNLICPPQANKPGWYDAAPFFGALAMRLRLQADPHVGTAGTNGTFLKFAPEYVMKLTPSQMVYLVAHEVGHAALLHPWRRGDRDPLIWNLAADCCVDAMLDEAKFDIAPGGVYHALKAKERFAGMSAEQIYRILQSEVKVVNVSCGCSLQDGDGGSGEDDAEGGGQPHKKSAAQQMAEWEIATIQAAEEAAKHAAGRLPAGIEALIRDIKNPRLDWKALLRRFVQTRARLDYSWKRPSPRWHGMGLYMPELRSETMPPLVMAIDTSGSMSDDVIAACIAEVRSVAEECRPEALHIVCCDAAVQWTAEILPGDPVEVHAKGRGGTSFRPIFEWIEAEGLEPACAVVLTDMYPCDGWPEQPEGYPTLWCSTTRGMEAPWGETLEVYADE